VASLTDRAELFGRRVCGDAELQSSDDRGQPTIVLASSPTALVVLPSPDVQPGSATVEVSCARRRSPPFSITLVRLDLQADSSPFETGRASGRYGASARDDGEDCARCAEPLAGDRGTFRGQSGASSKQRRRGESWPSLKWLGEERQLPDFDRLVPSLGRPPAVKAGRKVRFTSQTGRGPHKQGLRRVLML